MNNKISSRMEVALVISVMHAQITVVWVGMYEIRKTESQKYLATLY